MQPKAEHVISFFILCIPQQLVCNRCHSPRVPCFLIALISAFGGWCVNGHNTREPQYHFGKVWVKTGDVKGGYEKLTKSRQQVKSQKQTVSLPL